MRLILVSAIALGMTACITLTLKSDTCPPDGAVTWVFYNELPVNKDFSKCIYCGTSIPESELYNFVRARFATYEADRRYNLEELEEQKANADAEGDDINQSLTPCFYTYNYGEYDTDTRTGCEADICSDTPSTNDMVWRDHGAWRQANGLLNINYE